MPWVLLGANSTLAGVLAVLILVGAVILAEFIAHVVENAAPLPGLGAIARGIGRGVAYALNRLGGLLDAMAHNVLGFLFNIPDAIQNGLSATYAALRGHLNLLRTIFTQAIPDLYRSIVSTASSIMRWAEGLMNSLFHQALNYANAVRAYVLGVLAIQVAALNSFINSVYQSLSRAITAGLANLTAYVVSRVNFLLATITSVTNSLTRLITNVRAELAKYAYDLARWAVDTAVRAATDWAKRYADALMEAYGRALSAATALALTPSYPRILEAIDSISLALPDSIAAVLARIGAIPRAIPRDIAVATGVATAVGVISLDWVARCGVSLCRNLHGFGDELAALGDAAMMAEIIALIAEAINDPDSAATTVHTTVTGGLTADAQDFMSILTAA